MGLQYWSGLSPTLQPPGSQLVRHGLYPSQFPPQQLEHTGGGGAEGDGGSGGGGTDGTGGCIGGGGGGVTPKSGGMAGGHVMPRLEEQVNERGGTGHVKALVLVPQLNPAAVHCELVSQHCVGLSMASCVGSVPLRRLSSRANSVICVSSPTSDGIAPSRLF